MKYYQNKFGYFLCTTLPVDTKALDGVKIINSEEEAEKLFRENNGVNDDDGVFIPSIIEQDGNLYGEALNTCLFDINTSIEDYISNYNL